MNIQDYMTNPMGKCSSVMMIGNLRRTLDDQYQQIYSRIKIKWYILPNDQYYIAHVKIPSRTKREIYYDVVLEFDMESVPKDVHVINRASTRVFSNCPSFTFTYANIFNSHGDLIPWLKTKYSKKIFLYEPNKRNPYKIINFERSLYFAIKYVLSGGRNYKAKISHDGIKIKNTRQVIAEILSSDEILERYNYLHKKDAKEEKREKEKIKARKPIDTKVKRNSSKVSSVKKVSKVKRTRSISKMKKL